MLQAWKVKTLHFTLWLAMEFEVPTILKSVKISKLNFGHKKRIKWQKNKQSYSAHFLLFHLFCSCRKNLEMTSSFPSKWQSSWNQLSNYFVKWNGRVLTVQVCHTFYHELYSILQISKNLKENPDYVAKFSIPTLVRLYSCGASPNNIFFQKLSNWS